MGIFFSTCKYSGSKILYVHTKHEISRVAICGALRGGTFMPLLFVIISEHDVTVDDIIRTSRYFL